MLLIPAIDIREGRCVRLYQGDFEQETHYAVDPAAIASEYATLGAPWLHVVDLDGAQRGEPENLELVERIRSSAELSIQLGGGIRKEHDLARALGIVQRVVVGSLAVNSPELVARWLETYGGDRLVLALDVRVDANGVPRVATHGWTRGSTTSLWDAIDRYRPHGLAHVLCTDVARDGALSGPNLDLYVQCRERAPDIAIQASGGIRDAGDLAALAALRIAAAISGKALLEGRLTTEEIRPYLRNA
jgi:phosphoribosylformimino-5-aminoimidazole carboxamide ribotide isomerase